MDHQRRELNVRLSHVLVVAVCCVSAVFHNNAAFAQTEKNNTRMIFYGIGIGWGSIICDFYENQILDKTLAEVTLANIKAEMKTDATYTLGELGLIRSQAVKDGFNASVKEMKGCPFKF